MSGTKAHNMTANHMNLVSEEDLGGPDRKHSRLTSRLAPLASRGGERPCEPLLEVAGGIGLLTAASKEDVAPQVSEILGMVAELGQKLSDSMKDVVSAEIVNMVGQAVAHVATYASAQHPSALVHRDGSQLKVKQETNVDETEPTIKLTLPKFFPDAFARSFVPTIATAKATFNKRSNCLIDFVDSSDKLKEKAIDAFGHLPAADLPDPAAIRARADLLSNILDMLVCLQCFAEDSHSDVCFVQALHDWVNSDAVGQNSDDRPLLSLLLDGARAASQVKKFLVSDGAGVVNGDNVDSLLQVGVGRVESGGAQRLDWHPLVMRPQI